MSTLKPHMRTLGEEEAKYAAVSLLMAKVPFSTDHYAGQQILFTVPARFARDLDVAADGAQSLVALSKQSL